MKKDRRDEAVIRRGMSEKLEQKKDNESEMENAASTGCDYSQANGDCVARFSAKLQLTNGVFWPLELRFICGSLEHVRFQSTSHSLP